MLINTDAIKVHYQTTKYNVRLSTKLTICGTVNMASINIPNSLNSRSWRTKGIVQKRIYHDLGLVKDNWVRSIIDMFRRGRDIISSAVCWPLRRSVAELKCIIAVVHID